MNDWAINYEKIQLTGFIALHINKHSWYKGKHTTAVPLVKKSTANQCKEHPKTVSLGVTTIV